MINIFRKIRQQLLIQNKFRKYLQYAVGEIVLVVCGILIALSINNWNEQRKETNIEHNYLVRLLKDLENDNKTLVLSKELSVTRVNQIILLTNVIYDNGLLSENPKQIIKIIEEITWRSYLPLSRIVYNELLNSGNMTLIQSEQLREHVANYYGNANQWERIMSFEGGMKEFSDATAGLLSKEILGAIENSESFDKTTSPLLNINIEEKEMMRIIQELSENKEALKWLPQIYQSHIVTSKVIIKLKEQNETLINLIHRELENNRF
jgi:hypothetical protein